MARIKIIEPDQAEGKLKSIYEHLIETRGKLAEVHKMHSIHPEILVKHMDLYMALLFGQSPLKRAFRELIGVIVSINNNCRYCIMHHAEALNFYWKDSDRLKRLLDDYKTADLDEKEKVLCQYASELTSRPDSDRIGVWVDALRKMGFNDRAIHDITAIAAYFNFVNRMVLGLGIELEADYGGYKY